MLLTRIIFASSIWMACSISAFGANDPVIYHYYNSEGIAVFTDQKPKVSGFRVVEVKCQRCEQSRYQSWYSTPLHPYKFRQTLYEEALKNDLDVALLQAIVHAESGYNPNAQSHKGAKGLMQLMPLLVKAYNIDNPFDPDSNIAAGSAYFAKLLKRFKGNTKLAAAAYNAGPGNVAHYSGVPPFQQTRDFVKRVDILHNRYRQHQQLLTLTVPRQYPNGLLSAAR